MKSHVRCSSLNILHLLDLKVDSVCGKPRSPHVNVNNMPHSRLHPFLTELVQTCTPVAPLKLLLLFTKGVNCHLATGLTPGLLETVLGKRQSHRACSLVNCQKFIFIFIKICRCNSFVSLSHICVSLCQFHLHQHVPMFVEVELDACFGK